MDSDSSPVFVPLESLPIAAAGVQEDGTIVRANFPFRRLFRYNPARTQSNRRLPDLIVDPQRHSVAASLRELAEHARRTTLRLTFRKVHSPHSFITLEIRRLGEASPVPYLVCAYPIPKGTKRFRVGDVEPTTAADTSSAAPVSWPPLLSTLSHELRGSLNAIRGWAAVAENGTLPSDRIPRAVSVIKQNAESLTALIDTLFDLSRNAAGSLVLKLEPVDLNQLARLVAESSYPAAERHRVTVHISSARGQLLVRGDRIRLEQVVRNLVDNAIKFTPAGGRVTVRTEVCAPFARLVIRDTGIGISRDLLPVIFDPFRQGESRVAAADLGIGLGLALARELVRLHHGRIEARSAGEGRGSTFIVKLPLAAPTRGGVVRGAARIRNEATKVRSERLHSHPNPHLLD